MSDDWIQIQSQPIDAAKAMAAVGDPGGGAVAVFLGTTRGEKSPSGADLLALEYEAYEAMAIQQMTNLAIQARSRWPIRRLAMLHRIGRVDVGQPSVLIAVCCPHRAQAFDACRFLIDSIKTSATIWKKELWSDATQSWSGHAGTPPGSAGRD